MATPRLWIIVVRNTRAVRKHIRGYAAELTDSELTDAIGGTLQPPAADFLGVRNSWQRPVVSAPIPGPPTNGDRLAMWGVWESVLPQATQDLLDAKEVEFPLFVQVFKQQVGEEPQQMVARAKAAVRWIDQPTT